MGRRSRPVSWKQMVAVFERLGFKIHRTKGDHIIMVKKGVNRPVVVPKYKAIGNDIILANCRTAGISKAYFIEMIEGRDIGLM